MIRSVEEVCISSTSAVTIKQEIRLNACKTEQLFDAADVVDLTDDIEEVIIPDLPRFKWMDKLETRAVELYRMTSKALDPSKETIDISDDEAVATDNGSVDSGCMTSDPEDALHLANANAVNLPVAVALDDDQVN